MTYTNLVYLQRRAGEERDAALNSKNDKVRGIHLELADAYETHAFLVEQLAGVRAGKPLTPLDEGSDAVATKGGSAQLIKRRLETDYPNGART